MENTDLRKQSKAEIALTKWLPMSAAGAAISFVVAFVLHVPQPQVIVSAAMTATLIFSGLAMNSFGRPERSRAGTR